MRMGGRYMIDTHSVVYLRRGEIPARRAILHHSHRYKTSAPELKFWLEIDQTMLDDPQSVSIYRLQGMWTGNLDGAMFTRMDTLYTLRKPRKMHRYQWARHVCAECDIRLYL